METEQAGLGFRSAIWRQSRDTLGKETDRKINLVYLGASATGAALWCHHVPGRDHARAHTHNWTSQRLGGEKDAHTVYCEVGFSG